MSNRLQEKARAINFDEDDRAPAAPPRRTERPHTGPGAIGVSLAMGRGVLEENERLKERVAQLEDAKVIEFLDPKLVGASRVPNRHELSFDTPEFESLRKEIASAGRNVQAIKVRELDAPRDDGVKYEIVYGHRRHRACLLEGVPVAAVIERLDDVQLFAEMDRENRDRANLSPWEQGVMYAWALEQKLFPSLRRMAEVIGADAGNISKAIQLASLPKTVIDAFPSPLQLQFRWAGLLTEALKRDESRVLKVAEQIRLESPRPAAKEVFERLTAAPGAIAAAAAEELKVGEVTVGSWVRDARGNLTIKVKARALTPTKEQKLREGLARLLA